MKALKSLTICMLLTCAIMLSATGGTQSPTYEENPNIAKLIIEEAKKNHQLYIDDLFAVAKKRKYKLCNSHERRLRCIFYPYQRR